MQDRSVAMGGGCGSVGPSNTKALQAWPNRWTTDVSAPVSIRPATLADVPALHQLISDFARQQLLLSRSAGELYETIRDFLVIECHAEADTDSALSAVDGAGPTAVAAESAICGCVALHIVNAKIAEIKSLAVAQAVQGQGLGRVLVEGAIAAAVTLGLERVFCLTYQQAFFGRLGFGLVDRARLPEKVWGECVRCNKFLNCDEIAMWRLVSPESEPAAG